MGMGALPLYHPQIMLFNNPTISSPPPLPPSPLSLPLRPHSSHSLCNACGSHSVNMSAYTCFDCSFTLHVVCASLTPTTKTVQSRIQLQPTHPHPLISCDLNKNKCNNTYTCSSCSQPFDDERSVVYVCLECKGLLHKTCAQLPRKIDHSLHPSHPLILLPQKPRFFGYTCGACCQYKDSFIYHCSDCEFYLDIACASLNPNPAENNEFGQIRRFSHPHPLILCDNKQKFEICCYACQWYMDVRCALSKPKTMMSKIHPHPLALFNKPNYDIYALLVAISALPLSSVVCCATSISISIVFQYYHLHSSTSIMSIPSLSTVLQLKTILMRMMMQSFTVTLAKKEECWPTQLIIVKIATMLLIVIAPYLRFLVIIHILEEEWSQQESNRGAEQVEEPTSLTLKQFLDSFNGDENKEVQGVFDAYRRDSQGDSSDNPKDSLYLNKASTEIMKILVSKNQVTMPWENWNSTSKLIKVDNYMILENLAPILGTLFGKYGDFSGMSTLSPKAKMLYIMTVCDAVNSMLSAKVKDITTNLLLTWFHCFMLGHYAGFEIQFAFGRLTRVVRSHFGLQADVSTDLTLAKLDEEIGEQRALLDSKEIIDSEQDREIDKLRERIASMQLTSTKVHKEITELHKKIKTLEEKHAISRFTEECLSDSLELEGQTAGRILCSLALGVDLDHLIFDRCHSSLSLSLSGCSLSVRPRFMSAILTATRALPFSSSAVVTATTARRSKGNTPSLYPIAIWEIR
ncbi:unnamed protein product [Camellia sinensis]